MIEVNEYFDGRVKSLVMNADGRKKTLGVMTPGEYEFDTQTKETMTVIEGEFSVYFSEYDEWEEFGEGASFDVPAQSTLKVKVTQDTAYLCEYE